jgi:hypothetical protein
LGFRAVDVLELIDEDFLKGGDFGHAVPWDIFSV